MPSKDHDKITEKAAAWLKQQGFTDVMVEAKIITVGSSVGKAAPKSGNPRGTTLTPDVIGYNGTRKAIVECGSVRELDRLYLLVGLGYEVYLWPYDAKEPYLWSEEVNFCRHCGRKFEHLDRVI